MAAGDHLVLGLHDLLQGSAEVHRRGAVEVGVGPRDRPVECPVDFPHTRAAPERRETAAVAIGHPVAADRNELGRRDIEDGCPRRRELVE